MNLTEIRSEIDKINKDMLSLFEKRMDLVGMATQYKMKNNIAVLDRSRETEIIEGMKKQVKNEKYTPYAEELFKSLLELSRKMQIDISGLRGEDEK